MLHEILILFLYSSSYDSKLTTPTQKTGALTAIRSGSTQVDNALVDYKHIRFTK